jgi:uncharacterized peroxidase-related enzyme
VSAAAPIAAIHEGWIASIALEDATGELAAAYQVQLAKIGHVTALTQIGSLYPQIVAERLRLYEIAESAPSSIPDWGRRAVALLTSVLNGCQFCTVGHTARLNDAGRSELAEQIKLNPDTAASGDASIDALLIYVRKLVRTPGEVAEADIRALRTAGWSDLDIVDVNNLSAYYSYINRVATGLGLTREA